MFKLSVSRRYPFLSLSDVGLRRQVDLLRQENEDLRTRIVAAQDEKSVARKQAEELRKQKERLRLRVAEQKQDADAQKKVIDRLQEQIYALRQENEQLKG